MRTIEINGDGVTGTTMGFAEGEHKKYIEYDDAILQLEDLIDILEDPGVTYDGESDLPLFKTRSNP
jgi:hypothetical protein